MCGCVDALHDGGHRHARETCSATRSRATTATSCCRQAAMYCRRQATRRRTHPRSSLAGRAPCRLAARPGRTTASSRPVYRLSTTIRRQYTAVETRRVPCGVTAVARQRHRATSCRTWAVGARTEIEYEGLHIGLGHSVRPNSELSAMHWRLLPSVPALSRRARASIRL